MTNVHCIMQARQMGKSEAQRKMLERLERIAELESCAEFYQKRIHHGFGWLVFPFTNMELIFRAQSYRERAAALRRKPL